jgi:hypothetical protein
MEPGKLAVAKTPKTILKVEVQPNGGLSAYR